MQCKRVLEEIYNTYAASSLCEILPCSLLSLDFRYLKRVSMMKDGSKGLKNHSSSVKIQSTYQTYESKTHGEPFNKESDQRKDP